MTFESAYRAHYRSVVASSWAITHDRDVAEELTQEAFARAYRRWRKLDDGGYAVPWVHRVVMNLSISHVRRRTRGAQIVRRHAATPATSTDTHRDEQWLVRLLDQLPRRQREAVFLRYVVDLDVAHVAAVMRCTTGTVKTHSKRGLDRLRELVGPSDAALLVATHSEDASWIA